MIEPGLLARIADGVSPSLGYDELTKCLRASFPGVHITVCGEDDVPPRLPAAAENEHCFLYYVDSSEHCLKLTADAETATGVVVALRSED